MGVENLITVHPFRMNVENLMRVHAFLLATYLTDVVREDERVVVECLDLVENSGLLHKSNGQQFDIGELVNCVDNYRHNNEIKDKLVKEGIPSEEVDNHLEVSRFMTRSFVAYLAFEAYLKSDSAPHAKILGKLQSMREYSKKYLGQDIFSGWSHGDHLIEGSPDGKATTAIEARKLLARLDDALPVNKDYVKMLRFSIEGYFLNNPTGWIGFFNAVVGLSGINNSHQYQLPKPAQSTINYILLEPSLVH